MSGLLDHGNNPDKKVNVNVNSLSRKQAGFVDTETIPTFDVNMRVDNHTRNAVLALAKTTADKRSASEMVSILIETYLETLNPQSKEIYQDFVDMLENKDKLDYKMKNR
ncbi:DUF5388 domain-containing protein [Secundilactobacillus kimchicus]|uniref:DUF5388 domain-containing protein n=1 Tax=Secundilactobacillus kimchicus TaxID=528209 RepID=UPI0024A82B17|nr:DUF5388 domain-containing protein [Secundilactobacillus kimchicus]